MGQKISRMHLYYAVEDGGNPYVSFNKDDRAIGKTIARIDNTVARIARRDYSFSACLAKLCQRLNMCAYCDNQDCQFRKNAQ